MPRLYWATFLMFSAVIASGCGGGTPSTPQIQSLQINQQSTVGGPAYTATATLNDGKQVNPASVSWVVWNYSSFSNGQPHYVLTSSPYPPVCGAQCTGWTLVAIAPADPNAPKNGRIPLSVFQDLISGKATSEAGFVAAIMQL